MISDWRIIDQVHSFRRTITVSSTERAITKQLFVYCKRRVFFSPRPYPVFDSRNSHVHVNTLTSTIGSYFSHNIHVNPCCRQLSLG